jgi:hypothetical protein
MEAVCCSEKLLKIYQTIQHHIPEDSNRQSLLLEPKILQEVQTWRDPQWHEFHTKMMKIHELKFITHGDTHDNSIRLTFLMKQRKC